MGGLDPLHAMRLLIPPAWHGLDTLDPDLRAFYEYYSVHMEPWDGPAGVVLTDGRYAPVHARSQRPAARALLHHPQPRADDRLRVRRLGLRARGCGDEGQARARRHDRARPAERHAARLGRHRPAAEDAPSLQGLAQAGRALPARATWSTRAWPPSPWTAPRSRSIRRCSTSRRRSATTSSACWRRTRTRRSARWATTRRCRCSRTACARSTTTSASSSRRSPTRRSIRCARSIVMSLQTQIGPECQRLRAGPRACAPGGARLADPLAAQAAPDPRHRGGHARVSRPAVRPRRKGCKAALTRLCASGRECGARGQARAAAVGSLSGAGTSSRCTHCSPPARCTSTW